MLMKTLLWVFKQKSEYLRETFTFHLRIKIGQINNFMKGGDKWV